MPDSNDDNASRFERLEKIVAAHSEQIGGLVEHAEISNGRIEQLREAQAETNTAVKGLIGAVRDLTDRIPPEHLR